ncbi:AbiH family protein [Lacinutrix neustonica]|uniref:AbiH family protein n=1 Tax=Lacinutrix neustonica TaxID=2980107 RepID=A0A9E8MYV7_9FLAO|nr:AbiH family protein [Lacinutrix neustonica]WAC03042.1 AbiH family protein [Lacinutrix neustonica]
MNRIILIGNGFDLAHGMKTSYRHFIDSYWEKCIKEVLELAINTEYENEEIIVKQRGYGQITATNYKDFSETLKRQNIKLIFKNKFFQIITDNSSIHNWVDIENEYYTLLKNSRKAGSYSVTQLNSDFNNVKNKLVEYLKEIETNFNNDLGKEYLNTKRIIGYKIYHPFKLKDFSESSLNQKAELEYNLIKKDLEALAEKQITMDELSESKRRLIQRIDSKKPLSEIKKLLQSDSATNYFDLIPRRNNIPKF